MGLFTRAARQLWWGVKCDRWVFAAGCWDPRPRVNGRQEAITGWHLGRVAKGTQVDSSGLWEESTLWSSDDNKGATAEKNYRAKGVT